MGFAITMLLLLVLGLILSRKQAERKDYYAREGFITAGLTWLVVSIFGALPFTISGAIPSFVDSFFETVSGFTTTGASILTNVEALPMGMLYWRSFTHWLGGMGVLVFLLAISPIMGDTGDALYLLRAESPGINVGKLVPRMRRSAATLYLIYVALTVLQFVLLVFDMPVFDALTTAFGTAGTGGFAIKNDSLTSYSVYSQGRYHGVHVSVCRELYGVLPVAFAPVPPGIGVSGTAVLPGDRGGVYPDYFRGYPANLRLAGNRRPPRVLYGGLRHEHYGLCHIRLRPVAGAVPVYFAGPDVHRRLCRFHRPAVSRWCGSCCWYALPNGRCAVPCIPTR